MNANGSGREGPALNPATLASLVSLSSGQEPGEEDFLADLIRTYRNDCPGRLSAMEAAFRAGNLQGLMRACHALKGSSANIGADRVAGLCRDLEIKAATGQLPAIPAAMDRLRAGFREAEAELAVVQRSRGGT